MEVLLVVLNILGGWWAARESGLSWPRRSEGRGSKIAPSLGVVASFLSLTYAWMIVVCSLFVAMGKIPREVFDAIVWFWYLGVALPCFVLVVGLLLLVTRVRWQHRELPKLLNQDWSEFLEEVVSASIPKGSADVAVGGEPIVVPPPRFHPHSVAYLASDTGGDELSFDGGEGGSGVGGVAEIDSVAVWVIIAGAIALCGGFFTTRSLVRHYAAQFRISLRRDIQRFTSQHWLRNSLPKVVS